MPSKDSGLTILSFNAWWTVPSPKEPKLKRPTTWSVGQLEEPLELPSVAGGNVNGSGSLVRVLYPGK